MINSEVLEALEERMGVTFNNKNLLIQAITHRSYLNEHPDHPTGHYERLEFLGDAVLELLVTDHLYRYYPEEYGEGDLTNKRAALVETTNLAEIGKELNLAEIILMSKGERKNIQQFEKTLRYFMACCVEALLGALYLDQGLGECRLFVDAFVLKHMKRVFETRQNYKTELQEFVQAEFNVTPHYEVIEESGPDHERNFRVACVLEGRQIGIGTGSSKKEAQIAAARVALEALKENPRENKETSSVKHEAPRHSEPKIIVRNRRRSTEKSEQPSPSTVESVEPTSAEPEKGNVMERFSDQEFVEHIVRAIVEHPEDVQTERTIDEKGVFILLHINPDDMSYVVGRAGKNVDAIRTLLRAMGARSNTAVSLKIYESPEDFERHHGKTEANNTRVEG